MIITLTGNLLAERTFEFPRGWLPGKTQRAARESFQAGGKGINVSKTLIRAGAPTLAACFAGGAPGDECLRWLGAQGIAHRAFRTSAPTRTGLVVRATDCPPGAAPADAHPQPETTFLGADAAPDDAALAACAAWLDAQPASHTLAVCGSFPGLLTPGAAPLREAISRRIARGNVCVDTYGAPLLWFAGQPVALVKINRHEFDQLCADAEPGRSGGLVPAGTPARLAAACRLWPVRAWIITDGPGPVWYVSRENPAPASIQPPAICEISPTGSGDVLFAIVLHNMLNRNFSLAESVANAIPYASANASTSGIAEINIK